MMWQKARQIKSIYPQMVGKELWVEIGPPITIDGRGAWTGRRQTIAGFRTNHFGPTRTDRLTVIQKNLVELLPEFAEDVPLISWEDFINEHSSGR